MGGHHGLGINHSKTGHLCRFLLTIVDPVGRQTEGRVGGGGTNQRCGDAAGVDGQVHAGKSLALAHNHAAQGDAVATGLEIQVVTHVHGRRQEAHLLGKFAAHALDTGQQVALPVLVHQGDQAVAQLQSQLVDRLQVVPGGLAVGRHDGCSVGFSNGRVGRWRLVRNRPGAVAQHQRDPQKHHMRHARNQAQDAHDGGGDAQHLG